MSFKIRLRGTLPLKYKKKIEIFLTFETSTFLDIIFEDMSATRGTPFVSGIKSNSTPEM